MKEQIVEQSRRCIFVPQEKIRSNICICLYIYKETLEAYIIKEQKMLPSWNWAGAELDRNMGVGGTKMSQCLSFLQFDFSNKNVLPI